MGIGTHAHGAARSKGADDPILTSKITVPTLPGWMVPRPRVEKLITDGVCGPLTTVTGPPGAGKTMAIALWAASASSDTVAWLTLDSYDNRPKAFWSYVMAALRRAAVTVPQTMSAPTRSAVDHGFLLRLASVLGVASGIVLLIIAVSMILSPHDSTGAGSRLPAKDPLQLATFPLAVPYLLNPAGIVVLVTASAEAGSIGVFAVVAAALAVVIVIDAAVFRWANRVSEHLNENRMLVTEKVFGFLLAALAVQLALDGLADVGVIHLLGH